MVCGYIEGDRDEIDMGDNSRGRVTPGHTAVVMVTYRDV